MQNIEHKVGPNNIAVIELVPEEKKYEHPVVFVHGSFGGYMMWNMIANKFVQNGFHCYALSLRGHKPNDTSELGTLVMQDYVDDVKAVVEHFKLDKPTIIGHSMSGLVAMIYAKDNPVSNVISIGTSPSKEVQGEGDEEQISKIPDVYTIVDAGMPTNPIEVMKTFPDISEDMLMKMKEMLGPESGSARRDRKRGISIPKESVIYPILFMGSEHGDSVPFGVPFEKTKAMAEYYEAPLIEIKGATHPGIIMGEHAPETAMKMMEWLLS